jgi:hypothetical protein
MKVESTQPADLHELSLDDLIARPGVYRVVITPVEALALLERNTNNRPRKENAIRTYSRRMKQGEWKFTNQGIGVARNGELIDGQNRLYACIEADTPFPTLIATGIEPEAKSVVDVGVKRTLADALKMSGRVNTMVLAGGVALRIRYERLVADPVAWRQAQGQAYGTQGSTHPESIAYLNEHPSIDQAASQSWKWRKTFPKVPLSTATAFESLIMDEGQGEELPWFRDSVLSGAMLAGDDPRLVLRNYLTRIDKPPQSAHLLGIFIKAWNLHINDEKRELLTLKDTEPFPRVGVIGTRAQRRRSDREARAAAS